MTMTQDNSISRSQDISSKWNLCTGRKCLRSKFHSSLPLHLPSTYHVSFVSSRDGACEPFSKPRNSPNCIVQSIMGSLYNPANLNDPCQIQWILINLWTEICKETKLHLCNYGIALKSYLLLHLWDFNRLLKEEYLKTWWKEAKLCSPLHPKRHVDYKRLACIMTREDAGLVFQTIHFILHPF